MTQPPPDRAPEEQVSESVLASIESMGYTVHVTGKLLREMVRDCREAARLRARGVADEAARKVADLYVEEQQLGYSHKFTDPCACARCRLRWAVQGYQFALAATRAGNETNKAGEGDAVAQTSGGVPFDSARPSPATSTAEATAEERAATIFDPIAVPFIHAQIVAAIESHAAAAVKRAREECEASLSSTTDHFREAADMAHERADGLRAELEQAERNHDEAVNVKQAEVDRLHSELAQAVAAKERALAERDEMEREYRRARQQCDNAREEAKALRHRLAESRTLLTRVGYGERLRDGDAAAQPARQPAAPPVETVFLARELNDWRDAGAPPSVVALAILKLIRAEIARAAAGDAG